MFVANALAVAIAKRTAVSWPRTQANTRKYACQVAKDTDAATATDPTTLLHNQHRSTRQYPRRRERNPCLHLPARSPRREKHKGLDDNADKRRNPASCHVHPPSAEQLAGDLRAAICACRSGWILQSHATMSERADPSRRICVKCYDSRATDTPNRQRKTQLEGHSPLQSYFSMPFCAFRSDEKKRGRTRSYISDRFYDGNSLVDLLKKIVLLAVVIPRGGRPTRRKKQHFRGTD